MKDKVLERLKATIRLFSLAENLDITSEYFRLFESAVPNDVLHTYFLRDFDESSSFIFGGRDRISIDAIVAGSHPNDALEALMPHVAEANTARNIISLNSDMENELEFDQALPDDSQLYPLFEFEGSYILFNETSRGAMRGLIEEVDGAGVIFAPSIEEHLVDLIAGLESGVYFIEDDGDQLVYPSSWVSRKMVRAGKARMDRYGDIEE